MQKIVRAVGCAHLTLLMIENPPIEALGWDDNDDRALEPHSQLIFPPENLQLPSVVAFGAMLSECRKMGKVGEEVSQKSTRNQLVLDSKLAALEEKYETLQNHLLNGNTMMVDMILLDIHIFLREEFLPGFLDYRKGGEKRLAKYLSTIFDKLCNGFSTMNKGLHEGYGNEIFEPLHVDSYRHLFHGQTVMEMEANVTPQTTQAIPQKTQRPNATELSSLFDGLHSDLSVFLQNCSTPESSELRKPLMILTEHCEAIKGLTQVFTKTGVDPLNEAVFFELLRELTLLGARSFAENSGKINSLGLPMTQTAFTAIFNTLLKETTQLFRFETRFSDSLESKR